MKNLIIFSTLVVMAVINFTGCSKAQERPAKLNNDIAGKVVQIDSLTDITKAERQDTPENVAFKKQLIAKMDESKRDNANLLLAQNRLVYMLMDSKIVVLEFIPSSSNKHAKTASTSTTAAVSSTDTAEEQVVEVKTLHTYESLMAYKEGRTAEIASLKTSTWSQNHFVIIAEIEIQTGVLTNERTDYNEKKSILGLTETPLAQAQVLILNSEITTQPTATADASDAE